MPDFQLNGEEIDQVEEMRLLGLISSSDMKWSAYTDCIIERANKNLWVSEEKLTDIYS